MSHNYSFATEALVNEIGAAVYRKDYWESGDADRKFGPIKNSPVPFIPCQYHGILVAKLASGSYPGGNMYPDKSWEGARIMGSGQYRRTEFYGGFNVIKDSKGRCLIPDTPANRKRLENMASGKKQVLQTEMFTDEKGVQRSRRVMREVITKPLYTIIADSAAQGNLEEMIQLAAEKIVRDREEKASLAPDKVIDVATPRIELPAGIVDGRPAPAAANLGQPEAPVSGGDEGGIPPPPPTPQPTKRGRPPASLSPAAVAAAAGATGDDF